MLIRKPFVAGTFYPSDSRELKEFCQPLLNSQNEGVQAKAVILPHAGYIYSGRTASLVLAKVRVPDRVFLIGPNHRARGAPFALAALGEWETPLGRVPIDGDLASKFLERSHDLTHDPDAHLFEHSLEVEIPLLQSKNPLFQMVPLIAGNLDLDTARKIAEACGEVLAAQNPHPLVVISTDMNHYENDVLTREKDGHALRAIENLDPEALIQAVQRYNITMCGIIPVYMLLVMKKFLGLHKVTLVDYRTSGPVSGDFNRVVGYAGFIFE